MDAVISTASSTLSRQAGDSIESVDAAGQLNLVNAAKELQRAAVSFRFVSQVTGPSLSARRRQSGSRESDRNLNFTDHSSELVYGSVVSPALGFDYANRTARIYGPGTASTSWVSFRDVAEMCAVGASTLRTERTTIEFGGPETLSPLEVVARFEKIGGRPFKLEHVPEPALRSQFENATDPMQKTFAALMLGYLYGDAMNMAPVVEKFAIKLTSVDDYARSVLARAATT